MHPALLASVPSVLTALAQVPWPDWVFYVWPADHVALVALLVVLASIVAAYRPKFVEPYFQWSAAWAIGGGIGIVFLLQVASSFSNPDFGQLSLAGLWLSLIPRAFMDGQMWWSALTHMYTHGGFLHILGNGIMFAIFFIRLEQFMGRRRVTTLYLTSGLAGAAGTLILFPDGTIPNVGASGAIYGLLGYFVVAFPKEKVPIPTPIIMMWVRAPFALVFYIGYNVVIAAAATNVAWWAHLGGLIAGILWALYHRKRYGHMVPHWRGRRNDQATVRYEVR